MAGHLSTKGHEVTVYNRTVAKAVDWAEKFGGAFAETPAEAATGAEVVFTCVGNDDDLRSVVLGEKGAFTGMSAGAILVDNTTSSAEVARELALKAAEKGLAFVDAPVSGGQAGAENGVLTVMCGGGEEDFERARPAIEAFAQKVQLMGPVGSGQLTKMVNQICIAGLVQGLSEGLHFCRHAGLDIEKVVDVISLGAAGSWQMKNRHVTMKNSQYEFGFAVDWMRKDLKIVLDEARKNEARLPVTALVDQFYAEIQAMGGGRWDTSSLLRRLDAR